MVRLDDRRITASRLDNIGVDSALREIIYRADLLGLLLKDPYKLLADDLALCLRLAHTAQLVHKLRFCVDSDKVYIPVAESRLDLVTLVFAHKAVVNEDAGELAADSL